MNWKFLLVVSLLFAAGVISCKKDNNTVHPDDETFLSSMAYFNHAGLETGKLAVAKGTRDSIKIFGQMMVNDHTGLLIQVNALAVSAGISLPTGPDSAHLAFTQQLSLLSGRSFDTAYINGQVRDYKAILAAVRNEINNGHRVEIKNFAIDILPAMQSQSDSAIAIAVYGW